MTARHCAHCLRPTSGRLAIGWRALRSCGYWLKLCSFWCELMWRMNNPDVFVPLVEAFDPEAWRWVA